MLSERRDSCKKMMGDEILLFFAVTIGAGLLVVACGLLTFFVT